MNSCVIFYDISMLRQFFPVTSRYVECTLDSVCLFYKNGLTNYLTLKEMSVCSRDQLYLHHDIPGKSLMTYKAKFN